MRSLTSNKDTEGSECNVVVIQPLVGKRNVAKINKTKDAVNNLANKIDEIKLKNAPNDKSKNRGYDRDASKDEDGLGLNRGFKLLKVPSPQKEESQDKKERQPSRIKSRNYKNKSVDRKPPKTIIRRSSISFQPHVDFCDITISKTEAKLSKLADFKQK